MIKNGLFYGSNLVMLAGGCTPMAIVLSNLTYFSYIIYIRMKKKTSLNTLFGALVGSLPLLVGIADNKSNLLLE
jgi:heme O synthase-like polyprenyltransferase